MNISRRLGFIAALALPFANALAKADSFAYLSSSSGQFGVIDLNTGSFSQLGSSSVRLAGMATLGTTVFGATYRGGSGQLYSISTSTGANTAIGNSTGLSYVELGSVNGGGLYAVTDDAKLYAINSLNGQATLVGSTGVPIPFNTGSAAGISSNADSLYMFSQSNVYKLNTTSGAATFIGSSGSFQMGAAIEVDGVLYGGVALPTVGIATVNEATGATTPISSIGGISAGGFSLAPIAAVPEPSTAGYVLIGISAIFSRGLVKRRSKT